MSSSLSLAPVRSIRSIGSNIRTMRTPRSSWRHVFSSSLSTGSDRLRGSSTPLHHPTTVSWSWSLDKSSSSSPCSRCLSTSRTLLSDNPKSPSGTPKISKYRLDCNTPKVIKRRKKDTPSGKAIPAIVRTKPTANPRKAREKADAATREIMRKIEEAEAEALEPEPALSVRPKKPSPSTPTTTSSASKPTSLKHPTLNTASTVSSAPEPIAPKPAPAVPATPEPNVSQPVPFLAPTTSSLSSSLAGSVATQPAPISSGWSTRPLLQSYRLPPPELMEQTITSKETSYPTLHPLPKMAASIERRPSQAPQRIKRSIYRTVLDWSVHPTVQPNDFNALPDVQSIALPPRSSGHSGHSVKSTTTTNATTNTAVTASSGGGGSGRGTTTEETVVKKRYVSRRRIGFDDDDLNELDTKNQPRRASVVRLEREKEPRAATPSSSQITATLTPPHPRQSSVEVMDSIVQDRLNRGERAAGSLKKSQASQWTVSGIRTRQLIEGESTKTMLLKRPTTISRSESKEEEVVVEEKKKEEAMAVTAVFEPTRFMHADQILKAVLPDQGLCGSWREPREAKLKNSTADSKNSTAADGEYVFSPKAVLPALRAGLRKPFTLYYTDSAIHPRISQMVQECVETAGEMGLDIVKTNNERLDTLLGHQYHQGVLLRASHLPKAVMKALGTVSADNKYTLQFARGSAKVFDESPVNSDSNNSSISSRGTAASHRSTSSPPIWVVLDEIQTIYDMGHILSAAYYLGIDGVLIKDKNTVLPLASVSAASEGALEKRPAYAIRSLTQFIKASRENGWQVVGLKAAYGSKRLRPFYTLPRTGIDRPTILILGGDGLGFSKSAERQCDGFIHVPTLSTMVTAIEANTLPMPVVSGIVMSKLLAGRMAHKKKEMSLLDRSKEGRKGQVEDDDDDVAPVPWQGSPPEWELLTRKAKN
ncbi:Ribose methyltransferase [Mortierella sp. NVP41]|nr:Ribose methyltransferase [Mortierella sp. NVP41]